MENGNTKPTCQGYRKKKKFKDHRWDAINLPNVTNQMKFEVKKFIYCEIE